MKGGYTIDRKFVSSLLPEQNSSTDEQRLWRQRGNGLMITGWGEMQRLRADSRTCGMILGRPKRVSQYLLGHNIALNSRVGLKDDISPAAGES